HGSVGLPRRARRLGGLLPQVLGLGDHVAKAAQTFIGQRRAIAEHSGAGAAALRRGRALPGARPVLLAAPPRPPCPAGGAAAGPAAARCHGAPPVARPRGAVVPAAAEALAAAVDGVPPVAARPTAPQARPSRPAAPQTTCRGAAAPCAACARPPPPPCGSPPPAPTAPA